MTDKALEETSSLRRSLAPYPGEQRVALLPSVVRMLLTTFLEELGRSDSSPR
jgi:hypothetical protein